MKKIVDRFKNRVQNFKINFKKKFKEAKEKPKSKRKSFILGVTTAVAIFGVTLFGPALVAAAKDLPKGNPQPTDIVPVPVPAVPPNKAIITAGISRLASSVYSLTIISGSFALGIACGCIVAIVILQMQGK
jgi:hypothetical protein